MNYPFAKLSLAALVCLAAPASAQAPFRPPAVPLVTSNPYLSIWSEADHLTDDTTRHWTRHPQALVSLIRVDGQTFRLMGTDPSGVPALPQTGVEVTPTRSLYHFAGAGVQVALTFMTPALPSDLDVLARPVTYLTWNVRSADSKEHTVSLYDSASSALAVNTDDQKVVWRRQNTGGLTALSVGTQAQSFFDPPGDDTRIDWGYAYTAAPARDSQAAIGANFVLLREFVAKGTLPVKDDTRQPRAVSDEEPVLAFAFDLGSVGNTPVSRHVLTAYDEVYSIQYFGQKLRPYWRRNGATPATLLAQAEKDYPSLTKRCAEFDQNLTQTLIQAGGPRYAQMAALAYRESLAGCGLAADASGQPLLFTKENTSNGDIATVDVIFPMDPLWVFLCPALAKASLVPVLDYAASSHWKFPNAPHDLGTYPVARGTDDGGEGMPVEESGNLLLLCDAICHQENNPRFVAKWWPKLTQWAKYLEKYGEDPEEQLCTDDFMGHLAHNANLSVKAILGLAAYGDLCRLRGDTAAADRYQAMARGFAQHWIVASGDGDHSRLAFDKPGTWSQKYNLAWDHILGLNVFPPEVARKEVAYYKRMVQPYGVPLDSRTHITKTDWSIWTASLAENPNDFQSLVSLIYDYLTRTTTRDPISDSYETDNLGSGGMHARPVIGGLFIPMLNNPAVWQKWFRQGADVPDKWAAFPTPPVIKYFIPTSEANPVSWRYVTKAPVPSDWYASAFNDSQWQEGLAPFGSFAPGQGKVGTPWTDTPGDLWIRRTFVLPAFQAKNPMLMVCHDEDVEIYFNGVLAATEHGFNTGYQSLEINPAAKALLKPGASLVVAAHVHQTIGGQGIDLGFADITPR